MDIDKLIENAKACCGDIDTEDCTDYCINPRDKRGEDMRFFRQWLVHDLHTVISSLRDENKKLRAENSMLRKMQPVELDGEAAKSFTLALEVSELKADLARVTAERDAAVECLRNKCPFCRKYLACQGRTINNDCWEFFGLKEDRHETID